MGQVAVNFRNTAPYITDAPTDTYSLGAVYPEVRNGLRFGWSANMATTSRNRVTNYGAPLAGVIFVANGGVTRDFLFDLNEGPGLYKIRLALGDSTNIQTNQKVVLKDGEKVLATITGTMTNVAFWFDAKGILRGGDAWLTDNEGIDLVFEGSVLTVTLGNTGSGASSLSRVSYEFLGGSAIPVNFTGTVANQTATVGTPFSLDLTSYFNGSERPFSYELDQGNISGTGLTLSAGGIISGTPVSPASLPNLIVTAIDTANNEASTNEFTITINDVAPPTFNGPVTLVSYKATEFKLSYSAASSSATGYEVSIDGGTTYSSVGNSVAPTIAQVLPSVLSKVKVRAYDAGGRKSVAISPPLGVPGSTVPSTGEDGPAGLYDWLVDNPSHMSHLVHMHVINWPSGNTLEVFPNSSGRQTPLSEGQAIATVKPVVDGVETSEQGRLIFNSGDSPQPPSEFGIISAASYFFQHRRVLAR